MWTKDTLQEAESELDHWFAELYAGGAEPDREAVGREIRRILHQLAYDAWREGYRFTNPKTKGILPSPRVMGIDLGLIFPKSQTDPPDEPTYDPRD